MSVLPNSTLPALLHGVAGPCGRHTCQPSAGKPCDKRSALEYAAVAVIAAVGLTMVPVGGVLDILLLSYPVALLAVLRLADTAWSSRFRQLAAPRAASESSPW